MWQKGRKVNGHILEWFPLSLPATRKQSNLMKETLEQWKSNEIKSCFNLSVEKVVPQLRYIFCILSWCQRKVSRISHQEKEMFDIWHIGLFPRPHSNRICAASKRKYKIYGNPVPGFLEQFFIRIPPRRENMFHFIFHISVRYKPKNKVAKTKTYGSNLPKREFTAFKRLSRYGAVPGVWTDGPDPIWTHLTHDLGVWRLQKLTK